MSDLDDLIAANHAEPATTLPPAGRMWSGANPNGDELDVGDAWGACRDMEASYLPRPNTSDIVWRQVECCDDGCLAKFTAAGARAALKAAEGTHLCPRHRGGTPT